jgi:hypothetical protein
MDQLLKPCAGCGSNTFDDPTAVDVCIECGEDRLLCNICEDLAVNEQSELCAKHHKEAKATAETEAHWDQEDRDREARTHGDEA